MQPEINPNCLPVPSEYWYMTDEEYLQGTQQMLTDLNKLAADGCIAAAWALSVFQKISQIQDSYNAVHDCN